MKKTFVLGILLVMLSTSGWSMEKIKPVKDLISEAKAEKTMEKAKAYISDTLSFKELSQSEQWKEYIENWVALYLYSTRNSEDFTQKFIPQFEKVLTRTIAEDKQVALSLTKDLINFFEQFALDNASQQVAVFASGKGLNDDKITRLVVAAGLKGKPAPPIKGVDNFSQALIIFYESGCDNCERELGLLKQNYSRLKEKGIKIISVSADVDPVVFQFHSKEFPWQNKVCDYLGFEGSSFKNYGVMSTPTIFLTDSEGKITGRYARVPDTGVLK